MKKSELRQLIKEEINKVIKESDLSLAKSKALKDIELLKIKAKNDWGLLDDIKTQSEKIKSSTSIEQINKILNWLKGGDSESLDKISESQNEKNYEYFYNRISKGVDKFKQMLRDNGHID